MKPAPFVHHAPRSVEEAVGVLAQVGHDGKVLAGGQSLIPVLNMRLANPGHLVDVNLVAGLDDVTVDDDLELSDRGLLDQASWLSSMLGSLVTSLDPLGDGLEHVRRQRPRTAAAELLWQLLPPATAGNDSMELAAWIAPADSVGGDAYDYDLSQDSVTFAIYDAMGHGLGAGLVARVDDG